MADQRAGQNQVYIDVSLFLPRQGQSAHGAGAVDVVVAVAYVLEGALGQHLGVGSIGLYRVMANVVGRRALGEARMGRSAAAASHQQERSEEHTSELQSRGDLVCRLL